MISQPAWVMTLLLAWVRRIDRDPGADDPIVFGERAAKCSIGVRRVHLPRRLDDINWFFMSRGGQRRVLIRGTLLVPSSILQFPRLI